MEPQQQSEDKEDEEIDVTQDGGVLKILLKEGSSESETPKEDSSVIVNYTGKRKSKESGKWTSFEQKVNFEFIIGVGQVLWGVDLAVASMKKGEKSLFTINSPYAFDGDSGEGTKPKDIKPDETLRFEIELLDFKQGEDPSKLPSEEKVEAALLKKEQGNRFHKEGKYMRALEKYSTALTYFAFSPLEDQKSDHIKLQLHLNIAQSSLMIKRAQDSIFHCNKAMEIDQNNAKALFRRGKAYFLLNELESALDDFTRVKDISNTPEVQREIAAIKKKKTAFKNKEKKMYKKMFETTGGEEISSGLARFFLTLFQPGVTSQHITVLNSSFIILFLFLVIMVLVQGSTTSIHIYIFLALAVGVFFGLQWFLGMVPDQQKAE